MRYPSFLKKGDTIGLIAPSFGVSGYPYQEKYENAVKKLTNLGYTIKTVEHLYGIEKAASADAKTRAKEFMDMYLDPQVNMLISVAGGELMMQILPYLDFDVLSCARPKYVMGYSDNTNLTFTLPVFSDIAAIYGSCFGSFGMQRWDPSLQQAYECITGKRLHFEGYPKYEIEDLSVLKGKALTGYNSTEEVEYKLLDGGKDAQMHGRMIGGCLDILDMLCGTPYGKLDEFLERYKEDGFIWFLESCDLNVVAQSRSLWKMKQAGWFKYCKGVLYGRAKDSADFMGYTMQDALKDNLADLNIPIVYGCDFGHLPPVWTIISGAIADFQLEDGKASIDYTLEE